jgi:hypothetical protein
MVAVAQSGRTSLRVALRHAALVSRKPQAFRPAFAVVRIDGPLDGSMPPEDIRSRIAIKKIVWSEEDADAEVERLNGIERERAPEASVDGCFYFWQYTRVFDDGFVRADYDPAWMARSFLACDRDQELLLPPSLREWLPRGHLAWFVIDAVRHRPARPCDSAR